MIRSFGDKGSLDVYLGDNTKRARKVCPVYLQRSARMKLVMLDRAEALSDLDQPGSDLKKIGEGYQIRINKRYRIRFKWEDGDVDYVVVGEFHDD